MVSASVIIPNLDSPHLKDIIQALRQQSVPPLEVLIVGRDRYSSASDDGWVRVFATPPVPPARARNMGLAYARGEVCCFLDADCIPASTWLERLLQQQQQGKMIVGGSIAVGQGETFWQRCDNIASLGPLLETAPAGTRPYLATANCAIRRDILRQMGGFDLRFPFASGEDTDLFFRLRQHQYLLYFEPAAVVFHRTSRTQPGAIWKHIWLYGHQWPRIQAEHSNLTGLSRWQRICQQNWRMALLLIPFMTLLDTYSIYVKQPVLCRRHWPTCPVVFWARMAWYSGRMAYVRENQPA